MYHSQTYHPDPSDEPGSEMGGTGHDIPILRLEGNGLSLWWTSDEATQDDAVRYLTALAEQATALVEQIRERQAADHPGGAMRKVPA